MKRLSSPDCLVAFCAASAGATICGQYTLAASLFAAGLLINARLVGSIVALSVRKRKRGGHEEA